MKSFGFNVAITFSECVFTNYDLLSMAHSIVTRVTLQEFPVQCPRNKDKLKKLFDSMLRQRKPYTYHAIKTLIKKRREISEKYICL